MLHENIGRKTLRAFHDTILEWKCSHSSHLTIVIETLIKISLKFPLESFRKAFRRAFKNIRNFNESMHTQAKDQKL